MEEIILPGEILTHGWKQDRTKLDI